MNGIDYMYISIKTLDSIDDWTMSDLPVLVGKGANYARVNIIITHKYV